VLTTVCVKVYCVLWTIECTGGTLEIQLHMRVSNTVEFAGPKALSFEAERKEVLTVHKSNRLEPAYLSEPQKGIVR
jgi:hypothetical protein